jgi:hypothetical protein
LRNGAPFKNWLLPASLERLRRKLQGSDDGDRQMVKVLSAVLTDGLAAVEAACAEALADGLHSADVVLNILSRHRDPGPATTIPFAANDGLLRAQARQRGQFSARRVRHHRFHKARSRCRLRRRHFSGLRDPGPDRLCRAHGHTAIGTVTNLVARLCGEAKDGQLQRLDGMRVECWRRPISRSRSPIPISRSIARSGRGSGVVGYNVRVAVDDKRASASSAWHSSTLRLALIRHNSRRTVCGASRWRALSRQLYGARIKSEVWPRV